MFYSKIPSQELPDWDDADLSGAIWDEAVARAGGYSFAPKDVARLPFGFRCVLAEGSVRAHVEGDGLCTVIWNDDGAAMLALAADCHEKVGNSELSRLLNTVCAAVAQWELSTHAKPRSLHAEAFESTPLGIQLNKLSPQLEELGEAGFTQMMRYLREHPELFSKDG